MMSKKQQIDQASYKYHGKCLFKLLTINGAARASQIH